MLQLPEVFGMLLKEDAMQTDLVWVEGMPGSLVIIKMVLDSEGFSTLHTSIFMH